MIVKIQIPRLLSPGLRPATAGLAAGSLPARASFHAVLTDAADDWVMRGTPRARFTPRPETIPARHLNSGMMARAWSWLHKKYTLTATKRLRVAETVSLGEKRFVALVTVEGREFLIGGGTAGVSLLAQLGAETTCRNAAAGDLE